MTITAVVIWLAMAFSLAGAILWALIVVPSGIAARAMPRAVPVSLRILISFLIMIAALRLFTFVWPKAAILSLFAFWIGAGIHLFWFFKSTGGLARTMTVMVMGGALVGVATALRQTGEPWLWLLFKTSMRVVA